MFLGGHEKGNTCCAFAYRLLYLREWFVESLVCVSVHHHVLHGRHREAHTL